MRKIKRIIDINHITGNTIAIPIFLTQKIENIGLWEDLSTVVTTSGETTVNINGVTDSKLSEVRGYDYAVEYTVGNNGITAISDTQISYTIGNIKYITQLSDLSTTFSFTDTRNVYQINNFISKDSNLTFVDVVDVQDSVFIEREVLSVIEYFSKLRQVGSVSEMASFNNGFYQINNQTI